MNKVAQMICVFTVGVLSFIFGYAVLSPLLPDAKASEPIRWEALPSEGGRMSRLVDPKYKAVCYKAYNPSTPGQISCIQY